MDKIVKIKFEEGQSMQRDKISLKQWDFGQILQVEGLELPDGNIEVHFSLTEYDGKAPIQIGTVKDNVITVDIPDFILAKENVYMPTYEAYAWIYVTDGESGETIRKIVFTIESRAEPTTGVPEDNKDKFLEEVRTIMNETKEIAQSVRDDADNGEFDGEKGEKGDAGSIEFKIVAELPTENIDENCMYLLQTSVEEGNNKFLEYIYVDGAWECIGSATVEVDLTEYVKKTDKANCDQAGVIQGDNLEAYNGGIFAKNGVLYLTGSLKSGALSEAFYNNRKNYSVPVLSNNLDRWIKIGLTDNTEEWTEEEKVAVAELLGFQAPTPNTLVRRYSSGNIQVPEVPTADVHATSKKYVDDNFIGKTQPTQRNYGDGVLIGFTMNGDLVYQTVLGAYVDKYSIPIRDANGILYANEPTTEKGLANKKYVDGLITDLQAQIDALKG